MHGGRPPRNVVDAGPLTFSARAAAGAGVVDMSRAFSGPGGDAGAFDAGVGGVGSGKRRHKHSEGRTLSTGQEHDKLSNKLQRLEFEVYLLRHQMQRKKPRQEDDGSAVAIPVGSPVARTERSFLPENDANELKTQLEDDFNVIEAEEGRR